MNDHLNYVLNSIVWSALGLVIGVAIGYMVGVRRKLDRMESELNELTHRPLPPCFPEEENPDDDA